MSEGYEQLAESRRDAMPVRSDIMPTRPRNMATQSTALEPAQSCDVIPSDEPTVNTAEFTSKRMSRAERCGSSRNIVTEKMK